MNRRWLCSDVWMDILPSFDHAQLGLKMALLSDRFDALVDTHFDGKSELTTWKWIRICKDEAGPPKPKVSVPIGANFVRQSPWEPMDGNFVHFPLPDRPLPNKLRIRFMIEYIDHSVIAFLRANQQIWDTKGTALYFCVDGTESDAHHQQQQHQQHWDVLAREIWPIFSANMRNFMFNNSQHLDQLCRRISPTLLTDLDKLDWIYSGRLFPDIIAADGSNASGAPQILYKWLHTPTKDGQPKQLFCRETIGYPNCSWVDNFEEAFPRATTSASYTINFNLYVLQMPIDEFVLDNERTNERMTLIKEPDRGAQLGDWLLNRCPLATTDQQQQQQKKDENSDAKLNSVYFRLRGDCIGPMSPPDQSDGNAVSAPAGPSDHGE